MRSTSTFVTLLAWVSILLTGLMTLVTLFQNLMFWTLVRPEGWEPDPSALELQPRFVTWIAGHLEVWFAFGLVVSVLGLIASVGLLRRRSWARRLYLGLLVVGTALVLAGVVALLFSFPAEVEDVEVSPLAGQLWNLALIGMTAATGALYVWLAWRLTRPAIRAEFERA
jgi:hypothetical protein